MPENAVRCDDLFRPFAVRLTHLCDHSLHTHPVHELYFATEDGGHQYWSDGGHPMTAGDLYFFPSGMHHRGHGPDNGDCRGLVINFSSDVFSPVTFGDAHVREVITAMGDYARSISTLMPTASGPDEIQALIEDVIDEMQQKRFGYVSRMKALLTHLLCDVLRSGRLNLTKPVSKPVSTEERIWEVCRFLESNYELPSTVDDMANMANMSRSYFHAQFKAVTGVPFKEYLNELRAKKALNLLETSDLPLEQLAIQSGFGSVSNFYVVFRKHIGRPPRQIRKNA